MGPFHCDTNVRSPVELRLFLHLSIQNKYVFLFSNISRVELRLFLHLSIQNKYVFLFSNISHVASVLFNANVAKLTCLEINSCRFSISMLHLEIQSKW